MAGEWKAIELGGLCEFRAGSVFKPAFQGQSSGAYPFVKVSDMNLPANAVRIQDANNWVSEVDIRELRARPFPVGTVVFAKIGEALRQNRLRQVARETVIDNNMMGAIPRTAFIEPRFFYYALSKFDFSDIAQGTALPYLTVSALSKLTIDVPPLPEQRAIAHILGTLDDKIELNRRMSETLEAMARAIFKSWFIDFDPVRRNAARSQNQPSPPVPLPGGEGRHGMHYRGGYDFAGLLEAARSLRKAQTPAEDLFWELVRDRRLLGLKFRRQHQLGDYIADFYCHEHRLVVEMDGGIHSEKRKKDHKRDAWMGAQGFIVLRFSNEQLFDDPESVLAAIAHVVAGTALPPLPSPLPLGEAGVRVRSMGEGRGEGSVEELDRLFPDSFEDSDLGEIPKGWKAGKVSDLCDAIYSGGTPSTQNPEYWDGDIPWLSSGETRERFIIDTEKLITAAGVSNSSTRLAPAMSTVIASAGQGNTRGQTSLLTINSYVNQSVVVLTAKPQTSSPYHQFFDLERRYEEFRRVSDAHSSRGSLTTKLLAGLDAVLPPHQVNRAFDAAVADAVKRIVRNLHESRTLAALRDTLLPKLLSGELRLKGKASVAA